MASGKLSIFFSKKIKENKIVEFEKKKAENEKKKKDLDAKLADVRC